jgi:hypothetical protein
LLNPRFLRLFWWAAVALIGLLLWVIAPLLLRDRLARFWAAGTIFASIPVCATFPMDRLLTFVGIGAFGLIAQFWEFVFVRSKGAPRMRWWRLPALAFAWYLVIAAAILAPLAFPVRAANPVGPWLGSRAVSRAYAALLVDR